MTPDDLQRWAEHQALIAVAVAYIRQRHDCSESEALVILAELGAHSIADEIKAHQADRKQETVH